MSTARVKTVAEALRNLRGSARIMEKQLAEEIRRALAEGVGAEEIARAAGITRQRVYQIRDGRR